MSRLLNYVQAFENVLTKRVDNEEDKQLIKQNVFYGVKLINELSNPETYDHAVNNFQLASAIKQVMGLLTPKEFMTVFPVQKHYKGYKWNMKDYFHTMDYIKGLNENEPIGEDIMEFLWNYMNIEIERFVVKTMCLMSDIRFFEGKPSLVEEWADMNDLETFTLHTDHQGKQYIMDKQGRTHKVKKPRPKHLKLVH